MHDHRNLRYFLPGIAIAALALAWLLGGEGRLSSGLRLVVLGALLWQVGDRLEERGALALLWISVALIVGYGLEIAARRRDGLQAGASTGPRRGWIKVALAAALLAALPALGRAVRRYQEVKLDHHPAERALELLAGPSGARVAYAGFNQPYLFFGGRLQNDLQLVPRNGNLEGQYYDWNSRFANPYVVVGYQRWRANLEARKIDLVVVILDRDPTPEQRWLRQHQEGFDLAYSDGKVEIWRVARQAGGG
jgi:hypothetical protein